jgi:hypothetical protein
VKASGPRLAGLVMHAELERVVCSGPRHGRQFTYALFEERVPPAAELDRDEALAELTRRYFTSHGPATLRDYAWWSGLTMREGRRGLEILGRSLTRTTLGGLEYFGADARLRRVAAARSVFLLPNYDECLIAYKDRGPSSGTSGMTTPDPHPYHVIADGRLAGSWRRMLSGSVVTVDVAPYDRVTPATRRGLERAVERLGTFMGVTTGLKTSPPARASRTKIRG